MAVGWTKPRTLCCTTSGAVCALCIVASGCTCTRTSNEAEPDAPAVAEEEPESPATPWVPPVEPEPAAVEQMDPEPMPAVNPELEPEPEPNEPTVEIPEPTPEVTPPPSIASHSPERGPWGTVVTLEGEHLGSEGDARAALRVGPNLLLAPDDDEVLHWTSTLVEFRVPFPHAGLITLQTEGGSVEVGSFSSEWRLGEPLSVADGATVITSVSPAPGEIVMALDTTPVTILRFDAAGWTEATLDDRDLDMATLRLYLTEEHKVGAFGLSNDETRALFTFQESAGWAPTPTEFSIGSSFALAGGPLGGVVWHETADGWERLSTSAQGFVMDKGPIADPKPDAPRHTAGATGDGQLFIAYSVDTGNFFDDMEAPYFYRLPSAFNVFDNPVPAGRSADDYLTSLALVDHGRGLLVEYCGSDVDPLSVTGTAYRCYTAAHSVNGHSVPDGTNESAKSRYAFTEHLAALAYCDADDNTRLTGRRETFPGVIAGWPCLAVEALEIDADGQWMFVTRYDGALYRLSSVLHSEVATQPDDGSAAGSDGGLTDGTDAGTVSDAGAPDAG